MVAHLVRLKLTLLRNGLRRSAWQVVGLVFGALYGLGILAVVVPSAVALSLQDVALQRDVTVLLGALLVLGWWVVPLLAFGVDATLDPCGSPRSRSRAARCSQDWPRRPSWASRASSRR
ncbi:hypothetical protein [Cellulomonas soli]